MYNMIVFFFFIKQNTRLILTEFVYTWILQNSFEYRLCFVMFSWVLHCCDCKRKFTTKHFLPRETFSVFRPVNTKLCFSWKQKTKIKNNLFWLWSLFCFRCLVYVKLYFSWEQNPMAQYFPWKYSSECFYIMFIRKSLHS